MKKNIITLLCCIVCVTITQAQTPERLSVNLYAPFGVDSMHLFDGISIFWGNKTTTYDGSGIFPFTDAYNQYDSKRWANMNNETFGVLRHDTTWLQLERRAFTGTERIGFTDTVPFRITKLGNGNRTLYRFTFFSGLNHLKRGKLIDRYAGVQFEFNPVDTFSYWFTVKLTDPENVGSRDQDRFKLVFSAKDWYENPSFTQVGSTVRPVSLYKVAPNPVQRGSYLTVSFGKQVERADILFSDMAGKVCFKKVSQGMLLTIPIQSSWKPGVYILSITIDGVRDLKKILVL